MSLLSKTFKPKHKITDFSDIGFVVNSMDDLMKFGGEACSKGERIDINGKGAYYKWGLSSGAELWAQVDLNNKPMGLHPGFSGKSQISIKAQPYFTKNTTPLDGGYSCWIITDDQEYPFVLDVPNFFQVTPGNEEAILKVQITAFAKEDTHYFASEDDRNKYESWSSWAVKSFAPAGSFNSDSDSDATPHAFISGYVREVELRKNEVTGADFYWLFVESLSASYDVVIDPQILSSDPKVGGIISGVFYLSGKIIQ